MGDVAYLNQMAPLARSASAQVGIPTSVILAQWAIESAWGTSYGATNRNNHGGISTGSAVVPSWSKAYAVDARPANEGGFYLKYRTVQDYVSDYVYVMKNSRYDPIRAAAGTPGLADDAKALGASPYAGGHYLANGIQGGSLIETIRANELWKYDGGSTNGDGLVTIKSLYQSGDSQVVAKSGQNGFVLLLGAAAVAMLTVLSD